MVIELFDDPNMYANKPMLVKTANGWEVSGYQSYELRKDYVGSKSDKFQMLVKPLRMVRGKTFLDLGGANGMYCFLARLSGATEVTIVDIDDNHLDVVRKLSDHYGFNIHVVKENIADITERAQVVLALALVHWMYSCTSTFGSLEKLIGFLGELTEETLIVEWISPDDPAIEFLKHIEFNKETIEEEYSFENFRKAISKYFREVRFIGDVSETRGLYICTK